MNFDAQADNHGDNGGDGQVSEFEPLPNARALTLATAYMRFAGYAPDKGPLTLRHWREEFYAYGDNRYRKVIREDLFADVVRFLNDQVVWGFSRESGKFKQRLNVTKKLVGEVLMQMQVLTQAGVELMPDWLDRHRPPRDNVIAFANGWIDIAEFLQGRQPVQNPPTPWWFSENVVPYDFRPQAGCPRWMEFLNDVLGGEGRTPDQVAECVQLLQEWFGYCLTSDTSQQKMLWLHGPAGAGKGTILRMLMRVVGEANCASPKLSSFGQRFGLAPLLGKTVAILADAHIGRQDDSVAVLDTILAITGNDAVDVERKNRDSLNSIKLPVRFTFGVNALPTLPDASTAIRRRTLIIPFVKTFEGRENTHLDDELRTETAGVTLWALEGLRSLRLRQKFLQPRVGEDLIDRMCRLASPIKSFIEQRCVVDRNALVSISDLYAAYKKWMGENGYGAKNVAHFGEDIQSALRSMGATLTKKRLRDGSERANAYEGIGLELEAP